MLRFVFWFGLAGGLLVAALRWGEYRFLVVDRSVEIYSTLVAALFAALGIWLGQKLTRAQAPAQPVPAPQTAVQDPRGLTPREIEVLHLVAQGLSNREIAEKLFVGENTVKTHCRRIFEKLGAKRRTQAVQLGKEFGVIP